MSVIGYTKAGADTAISSAVSTEATRATSAEGALTTSLESKADLVGGKLLTSQIPALALSTVVGVDDQAARLALTTTEVQPGDVAVQADTGQTFMLVDADPSETSSWFVLPAIGQVQTVNDQQGVVVLGAADVGADSVGSAAAAQTAAESYADTKVAAEVTRANGAYDALGSATSAITSANSYTDGKISAEVTRANAAYAAFGSTGGSTLTDNGDGTFTAS